MLSVTNKLCKLCKLSVVMLNVIMMSVMLSVTNKLCILSVVMLNVIMLSVVALSQT